MVGLRPRRWLRRTGARLHLGASRLLPGFSPSVDVIVCVHNALDHTRRCLAALMAKTRLPFKLIIVNDGSDEPTSAFLRGFANGHGTVTYIHNGEARGYTRAANQGLRVSTADFVVLLNSDTVVTPDWLRRLLDAARVRPDGAIFGPLSNAAGWQSIPESTGEEGGFVTNTLPPGVDLDAYAGAIGTKREPLYPRAWIVNGFCYMLSRKAIESLGVLDEEAFPQGYGEEDDYSLRAMRAGFKAYVVDNCYVYHAKSKSFTAERRQQLKGPAQDRLYAKHGRDVVSLAISETRQSEDLERARVHSTLLAETASNAADGRPSLIERQVNTGLFRPRPVPQSFQLGCLGTEWLDDEIALAILRATVGLRRLELTRADLTNPELPAMIAQCRIFVSGATPNKSPLLPLQAMACGVPVVIVDDGSACDFAEHGANALAVPLGDQDGLREAVRKLLTNNVFRRRLIANGLRTAWRHNRAGTASLEALHAFDKQGGSADS